MEEHKEVNTSVSENVEKLLRVLSSQNYIEFNEIKNLTKMEGQELLNAIALASCFTLVDTSCKDFSYICQENIKVKINRQGTSFLKYL